MEKGKGFDVSADSYIVNFTIMNQSTNAIYNDWLFFPNDVALLGYIKYVVLPSGYCSRLLGELQGKVYVCAETRDMVIKFLENSKEEKATELVDYFREDYTLLESVDKENFNIKDLNKFCESFNSHLDFRGTVFSSIVVLNNIKEVGNNLVCEYRKNGMIKRLEEEIGLSEEEIIKVFSNIEENEFMLERVNKFLKSKMLL